jgi:1-acyl-sn-glycerol-3-phosphate acyltransferase
VASQLIEATRARSFVEELLRQQRDGSLCIVITPEGTRGSGRFWKSGFYRLALDSGLPVTLGYVDRPTMTTGLGVTLNMSGDPKTDMDLIRAFYVNKSGFNPELATEPRLSIEGRPTSS